MTSPLDKLLVDSRELDAQLLADVLEPYVRIDKSSREIRGTHSWTKLTLQQRALAYLLARKAMVALDLLPPEEEGARPIHMETSIGAQGNVLRKALSLLYKQRLVDKRGRSYYIPNHSVEAVKASLLPA